MLITICVTPQLFSSLDKCHIFYLKSASRCNSTFEQLPVCHSKQNPLDIWFKLFLTTHVSIFSGPTISNTYLLVLWWNFWVTFYLSQFLHDVEQGVSNSELRAFHPHSIKYTQQFLGLINTVDGWFNSVFSTDNHHDILS